MLYVYDKLCIEYDEFVPVIVTNHAYDRAKARGTITVHGYGGHGRSVAIEYESMPDGYKEKIRAQYGDPYIYASRQPILDSVEHSVEAAQYYEGYVLPNGEYLPNSDTDPRGKSQINYVLRYRKAAEWMNMIIKLTADKQTLKRELNLSMAEFWEVVTELIKANEIDLPNHPKRLKAKIKRYQDEGYESLIDTHKFGNDHASKLTDEVCEAFLKKMLSLRNKHDDTVIAMEYNRWATENKRPTLTPAAVGYRRKQWRKILMLEREGMGNVTTKLSKVIKRSRPSAPLLLVNSDDNVLDLYFRNGDNHWYRPVLYVVMDAFNDYILGYAWGDSMSEDLAQKAYRNAHHHVRHLTGDAYCWQQIQVDRWHISPARSKKKTAFESYLETMATLTPAAIKNAQSKYIERAFGTTWHQILKVLFTTNYSGHNITAKSTLNRDNLKPVYFPDIDQADEMIEHFIWAMRKTHRKDSGKPRIVEWVESFQASDKSKKKLLSNVERLKIFGERHQFLNEVTTYGITPTLCGSKRYYEMSQQQIYQYVGRKFQVYYDPEDLSQVLVTDEENVRFVVNEWREVPAALADYEPGDRARLEGLWSEKKALMPSIQKQIGERDAVLERRRIDAESRIQGGVLTKGINHEDQILLSAVGGIPPAYQGMSVQNYRPNSGGINPPSPLHQGGIGAENSEFEGGVDAENEGVETVKYPLNGFKHVKNSIRDRY